MTGSSIYFFFVEGGVSIREMQSINKRNVIFILIWGGNYLKSQTIRTDPSNGENRVDILGSYMSYLFTKFQVFWYEMRVSQRLRCLIWYWQQQQGRQI